MHPVHTFRAAIQKTAEPSPRREKTNMNASDPRITAYALGELNAAEQAEVQAAVAADPALAAEVEDIRRLAGRLKQALAHGDNANGHDAAASSSTRQAVEAALAENGETASPATVPNEERAAPLGPQPTRRPRFAVMALLSTTIAACMGGLIWFNAQHAGVQESPRSVSVFDETDSPPSEGRFHGIIGDFAAAPAERDFDLDQRRLPQSGVYLELYDQSQSMSAGPTSSPESQHWNYSAEMSLDAPSLQEMPASQPHAESSIAAGRMLRMRAMGGHRVDESFAPDSRINPAGEPRRNYPVADLLIPFPATTSPANPNPGGLLPTTEAGSGFTTTNQHFSERADARPGVNNFDGDSSGDRSPGSGQGGGQSNQSGQNLGVPSSGEGASGGVLGSVAVDKKEAGNQKGGDSKDRPVPARTWRRAEATPNASRLMIGEHEELPLQAVQANVEVDGFRARVLLDCYFYNDRQQQFEGAFKIRLPNESSLYFFAFGETIYKSPQPPKPSDPVFFSVERSRELGTDPKEIMLARSETWKEPKEAKIVPKEKAAYAYRETVRRKVDPALVEWAGAGIFSARVFPLAPQTLHRIVIGYDVNLLEVGDDLLYQLDLPRDVPQTLVDLRVSSLGKTLPTVSPEVKPSLIDGRFHYHYNNPTGRGVELRLPALGGLMLTGRDAEVGEFFAARVRVPGEAPQAKPDQKQTPNQPTPSGRSASEALFLVDTSLTAAPDRFNIYLDILQAVLRENRDSIDTFQVQFFNVESHAWKTEPVKNTPENVAAAVEYAQTLALEGATDLSQALRFSRTLTGVENKAGEDAQTGRPVDMFLLSDGAATWGQNDLATLTELVSPNATLFGYTTGMAGDDTMLLAQLAQATGGALFSVVGEDALSRVAKAHRSRPWQFHGASVEGGSDIVVAGRPRVVYPGQTLLIAGRGTPTADSVTLQLEQAGAKATPTVQVASLASDLTPRIYGQVATGGLEDMQPATEDVAVAYARHFRVAGQTCSLLMLETEQDYLRFNIKPEEDAFVVKSTPATLAMQSAEKRAAELRSSPKAAFLAYLDRLTKMPGMQLQLSPALRIAAESLSDDAFRLAPRPLACRLLTWQDLPSGYQDETLSSRPLAYAAVTTEAERRFKTGGPDDALKALSSLVELNPGDAVLARDVAYSALEWGRGDQAYDLFRRVAYARPYEPQTYHALAQCLATSGKPELAMLYYELAVTGAWDGRFGEFNQIAGLDYLRLLSRIERGEVPCKLTDFATARRRSLEATYSLGQPDLVITIAWNTDGTDVDLHVKEPTGEECFYSHRDTRLGGHMTSDVTQGFGPEMYVLRKTIPGEYQIRAKYFSSDANRASTRTRVFASVYRNWGTAAETVERRTITLETGKEMHTLANITVK